MSKIIETLCVQLERPREITGQVEDYLSGTYDVERDGIGQFLAERLPELEDYEHDLILSPLFTPKLADQAIFADLLGRDSIPKNEFPEIVKELLARPTQARLVTQDKTVHVVRLRDVSIERYVHRLRLEGTISEAVFKRIKTNFLPADRPLLKAIARRAIWETETRGRILQQYCEFAGAQEGHQVEDAVYLLELVESYKPKDISSLLTMIPPWEQTLRHEIDTASEPRPFFADQIRGEHGGDRDQRRRQEGRVSAKRTELQMLERIQQALSVGADSDT